MPSRVRSTKKAQGLKLSIPAISRVNTGSDELLTSRSPKIGIATELSLMASPGFGGVEEVTVLKGVACSVAPLSLSSSRGSPHGTRRHFLISASSKAFDLAVKPANILVLTNVTGTPEDCTPLALSMSAIKAAFSLLNQTS